MKIILNHKYEDIINVENILEAWQEFLRGKRSKFDVQKFSLHLMDNVFDLYSDLSNYTYKHGGYQQFKINDPKPRIIHKAAVRGRLLHHAVYRILYPFFDRIFISDSYSCRINKGTHKALNRFRDYAYKVSRNNTKTCYILKCDIRKFFANINHNILITILEQYIPDKRIIWLLKEIINSFNRGLPLGNLTSQLFANVYMNNVDQFIKHKLRVRYYIRYSDDFVILSDDKEYLESLIPQIRAFLNKRLKLEPHPSKISVRTLYSGQDFLDWINFPDHRILRTATKRRVLKRIRENPRPETLSSYMGLLKHGNSNKLLTKILY